MAWKLFSGNGCIWHGSCYIAKKCYFDFVAWSEDQGLLNPLSANSWTVFFRRRSKGNACGSNFVIQFCCTVLAIVVRFWKNHELANKDLKWKNNFQIEFELRSSWWISVCWCVNMIQYGKTWHINCICQYQYHSTKNDCFSKKALVNESTELNKWI